MKLREIYSVMFEIPSAPGHWTESVGRFALRDLAAMWAETTGAEYTVVVELQDVRAETRFTSKKKLIEFRDMARLNFGKRKRS
jgi:hypothetical protein